MIGKNVTIGKYSIIDKEVIIGDNCVIDNFVVINKNVTIDEGCHIHDHAVIGGDPQDLKYKDEETYIEIGKNNTIREFVTINRGTSASYKTIIGNNNLIMAYVHIAHDCRIMNNVIIANQCQLSGHIIIEDYAILGGGSLIKQWCRVGPYAMLTGGSILTKDVPPYALAGRYPVKFLGLNTIGLRRSNFTSEQINTIKNYYNNLYKGKCINNLLQPTNNYEQIIHDFIHDSKFGIITID